MEPNYVKRGFVRQDDFAAVSRLRPQSGSTDRSLMCCISLSAVMALAAVATPDPVPALSENTIGSVEVVDSYETRAA